MVQTTGGFASAEIAADERACTLPHFDNSIAYELGKYAADLSLSRFLPIAISIRMGEWEVFKAALPGSKPENDGWIQRKSRVVNLTGHSTMFERVHAEENGIDWHAQHGVEDATHAIHGGGFPIATAEGLQGVLVISGLPQVDDHKLAVEILKGFKASYQG